MKKPSRLIDRMCFVIAGVILGYVVFGNQQSAPKANTSSSSNPLSSSPPRIIKSKSAVLRSEGISTAISSTNVESFISEQDIQIALALNEQSKKGEYILEFERPTDRKIMEKGIQNFARELASNNTPALRAEFAKFGISEEKQKLLERHVEKIAYASLQAEEAIQQVLFARVQYDQRIRATLTDEQYAEYRQFENRKPTEREYSLFEEYAKNNNFSIDGANKERVLGLIEATHGYTQFLWHGPYDGLPQVAVGNEMVMAQMQGQLADLEESVSSMQAFARDGSLPSNYLRLLQNYYTGELAKKREAISKLQQPSTVSLRR
jgi:hypothetical protein